MKRFGQFIFFALIFLLLDLIWLGLIMDAFYAQQLSSLLKLHEGQLVVNLLAALFAYICLALAPMFFIFPYSNKETPVSWFAIQGALLGFVVYGIYDFTNLAVLDGWNWTITIADILWGTVLYSVTTAITGAYTRSWY